jgi:hypothetical protein
VSEGRHGSDTVRVGQGDGAETATVSPCRLRSSDTASDTVGSTSPSERETADPTVGREEEE